MAMNSELRHENRGLISLGKISCPKKLFANFRLLAFAPPIAPHRAAKTVDLAQICPFSQNFSFKGLEKSASK